jgi:hypothetical protein
MEVGEDSEKFKESCSVLIFDPFVFGFLGWVLVYHDFTKGGVSMFVLSLAMNIVMLVLGSIPVLGQIGYWYLSKSIIIPFVLNYFQISSSWLVTLLFWFDLIASISVSIGVIQVFMKRFEK